MRDTVAGLVMLMNPALGVHKDVHIAFEKHINEINRKVMWSLTFVNYFDKETRNVIVQSLVLSIPKYCNTIWGTAKSTPLNDKQNFKTLQLKS